MSATQGDEVKPIDSVSNVSSASRQSSRSSLSKAAVKKAALMVKQRYLTDKHALEQHAYVLEQQTELQKDDLERQKKVVEQQTERQRKVLEQRAEQLDVQMGIEQLEEEEKIYRLELEYDETTGLPTPVPGHQVVSQTRDFIDGHFGDAGVEAVGASFVQHQVDNAIEPVVTFQPGEQAVVRRKQVYINDTDVMTSIFDPLTPMTGPAYGTMDTPTGTNIQELQDGGQLDLQPALPSPRTWIATTAATSQQAATMTGSFGGTTIQALQDGGQLDLQPVLPLPQMLTATTAVTSQQAATTSGSLWAPPGSSQLRSEQQPVVNPVYSQIPLSSTTGITTSDQRPMPSVLPVQVPTYGGYLHDGLWIPRGPPRFSTPNPRHITPRLPTHGNQHVIPIGNNTVPVVTPSSYADPTPGQRVPPAVHPSSLHTHDNQLLNLQMMQQLAVMTQNMALPKSELEYFDGEPKNYFNFITNFENNIANQVGDPSRKLTFLIQYCKGRAKDIVRDCIMIKPPSAGYARALRLLQEQCGQTHDIARSYIDSLKKGTPIDGSKESLLQLYNDMSRCEMTLEQLGFMSDVNSTDTLKGILRRLPHFLRTKWAERVDGILVTGVEANFTHLCRYVRERARVASNTYSQDLNSDSRKRSQASVTPNSKGANSAASYKKTTILATDVNADSTQGKPGVKPKADVTSRVDTKPHNSQGKTKCSVCSETHFITKCAKFKAMQVADRCDHVRDNRLCFNCLNEGHIARDCKQDSKCKECESRHHAMVHRVDYRARPRRWREPNKDDEDDAGADVNHVTVNFASSDVSKVCLRIVPVNIMVDSKCHPTYALLDSGSNATLCKESFLKKIGVTGNSTTYRVTTLNQRSKAIKGVEVKLSVSALDGSATLDLEKVKSTPDLCVSLKSLPTGADIIKWPHLQGIEFPSIASNEVTLLIGSDVPEAFWVLEERRGEGKQPYATRTPLGWTLIGPVGATPGEHSVYQLELQDADDQLQRRLEDMWRADFNDAMCSPTVQMSIEDKRALSIMETTLVHTGERYQLSLPWRKDPETLPNNLTSAQRRLSTLKRKLEKDEELHKAYSRSVQDYVDKGYARKVTDEERRRAKAWYIPHHAVVNPNKPGKTRVVFDCAAKHQGVALNDNLLHGPDLVNSLVGVLMRFRQESITLLADIEAMFHQVLVTDECCDFLRFLWWENGDLDTEPIAYCMTRHIFGATSSPSCASFAVKQTARDNVNDFSELAVGSLLHDLYVDDLLKSLSSPEDAMKLIPEMRALLQRGGFNMTKWSSNNRQVLAAIPEDVRSPTVRSYDVNDKLPYERALGLTLNMEDDVFTFKIDPKEKPVTRRGILSVTSALYDPLGLVAPTTIVPKLIQQDLCRAKLGWDDSVPEGEAERWNTWLNQLTALRELSIPRCYKPPDMLPVFTVELHHFCDASETAYGAVSYVKLYDANGASRVSLVMGKARVAPIQPVTIPRLELSAAVVAVRLHQQIMSELEYTIDKVYFWSDSMSTLRCIRNVATRFKTFVANRLAIIHEATVPDDWRYVSTKENPADLASRGALPTDKAAHEFWLTGPAFLQRNEYPHEQPIPSSDDDDVEVKLVRALETHNGDDEYKHEPVIELLLQRSSSWYKVQKMVAWLTRFKMFCINRYCKRCHVSTDALSVDELAGARVSVIRYVQSAVYGREIQTLATKGKKISPTNMIVTLSPVMVDGLLRVGGRADNADFSYDVKHPVIVPGKHRLADLLIRECHEDHGHVGVNQVLSELRQEYWITRGISAVRRVLRDCFLCRKRHQLPCLQKMAALPSERLTADKPPFTYVGVDYFGPLLVAQGRSHVKRYGCLFTCLVTRAVHLEVAHSLDTESFLAALSRFMGRRGQPDKIYSDNGTNFVGAERELREMLQALNQKKTEDALLRKRIQWHFNPPSASHMGGVWERLVKSVKIILKALLKETIVNDETLSTVMCEVENIMNDRPITSCSSDARDPEPLTPNKLLLLKGNSSVAPGVFHKSDTYYARRWKHAHYIADQFWKRWLKEYVPLLQQRTKWYDTVRNLKIGDIVLVVEDNSPRGQWPLGVVSELHRGRDALVRSVQIKCGQTYKVRPIHKLCLLEQAM